MFSGCDVNVLNSKRYGPLYLACERNDEMIARKILECPKFNRKLFHVLSVPQPLFAAVANNHVHLVDFMIKAGCDINMVGKAFMMLFLTVVFKQKIWNILNSSRISLKNIYSYWKN